MKFTPTLIFGLILAFGIRAVAAETPIPKLNGAWFPCEFAHSRSPPPDDCRIMDDDGFLIAEGVIHYIKVMDSRHQGCRHERLGQCFERGRQSLVVERRPLGPISPEVGGFSPWTGTREKYSGERLLDSISRRLH